MRFLLVLSDAFDALRAYRGRVALALTGVAILGVLIAVYLPMIGSQRPSPQADVPRNTSTQRNRSMVPAIQGTESATPMERRRELALPAVTRQKVYVPTDSAAAIRISRM